MGEISLLTLTGNTNTVPTPPVDFGEALLKALNDYLHPETDRDPRQAVGYIAACIRKLRNINSISNFYPYTVRWFVRVDDYGYHTFSATVEWQELWGRVGTWQATRRIVYKHGKGTEEIKK